MQPGPMSRTLGFILCWLNGIQKRNYCLPQDMGPLLYTIKVTLIDYGTWAFTVLYALRVLIVVFLHLITGTIVVRMG